MIMIATKANMVKVKNQNIPDVFAWSPGLDERVSADPRDYFMMADADYLKDSDGAPMFLAKETTYTNLLETDEPVAASQEYKDNWSSTERFGD
jgi:hypothetical protein